MEHELKRRRKGDMAIEIHAFVGKRFQFTKNPYGKGKFAHRIYNGPPNGTNNRQIPAHEIYIDFSESFRITAVFANAMWTAFEFEVGGQKVWTNARKGHEWWVAVGRSETQWI